MSILKLKLLTSISYCGLIGLAELNLRSFLEAVIIAAKIIYKYLPEKKHNKNGQILLNLVEYGISKENMA